MLDSHNIYSFGRYHSHTTTVIAPYCSAVIPPHFTAVIPFIAVQ